MNVVKELKKSCPWWVKSSVARLKRTGIVLMYHRVNESSFDPCCLNVSPRNFNEHMAVIKKYGKTVQMNQMGKDLSGFNLSKDEIAITFDDGFSDNFHYAKPILEKYEIPATFYVPSLAMEGQKEFWWDKLSKILTATSLPSNFEISINNEIYHWSISSEGEAQANLMNDIPARNTVISKRQLLFSTWRLIRPLSYSQQIEIVDQILTWAGNPSTSDSTYLPMTLDELSQMANSSLFEIGGHTVHHPLLSAWLIKEQEKEIRVGKEKLEEWLNKSITSFAYPFGDHSSETPGILKGLGFQNACTVQEGPVKRNMNPYLLPRFMVFNWDGNKFEQNLRVWLTQRI